DLFEGDELEVVAGPPRAAAERQPLLQVELLDDGAGDDGVRLLRHVVVARLDEEAGAVGLHPQHAADRHRLAGGEVDRKRRLRSVGPAATTAAWAASARAAPASSAAAATVLLIISLLWHSVSVALLLLCVAVRRRAGCTPSAT